VNPSEDEGSPGVGHGWRPLAQAGTAQRGEWPTSTAFSGGRGARGAPPGRGLALPGPDGEGAKKRCPNAQLAQRRSLRRAPALPAPCRARTRAGPATGDAREAVDVAPHSPVKSPLTRDRGRYRGEYRGKRGETWPRTRGENRAGSEKISSDVTPSGRPARRRRFDDIDQPVSLEKLRDMVGTVGGGSDRFTQGDGLT